MNRKNRITTVLIALVVAVSMAAFVAPAAAQSADNIQTTLSDTDGDQVDDQVQIDVDVSGAARTVIELDESNFDVDVSPTDDTQGALFQELDPDGDGTPEGVQIDQLPAGDATFTVVADLSGQSGGDTGTVDVNVDQGTSTLSETYTVQDNSGGGPGGGTITVITGSQGDSVEAIDNTDGATEATGTTGPNGEVDLTVDPANGPFEILVNGNQVRLSANAGATIDLTAGGAQDPVNADGNRIVGGTGGNTGTIFLGEDDIALDEGVFRGVQPGQFTDADDAILTISNGVVDEANSVSTYTLTVGGTQRVVDVREPRIQGTFVIDALSNERLDAADEPTVEQPSPGDSFNVQFALDYNYFQSTSIDTTTNLLTQDGSDVTGIYLEGSRDVSLDPGGPFISVDERQRTYDALFDFDIDDTGEYTFNPDPRTGDDRADGRDVGFGDREDAVDTEVVTIIDDEDVEIELGSEDANQGDRVDFELTGLLEGQASVVTMEEEDFRYGDFDDGSFGELVETGNLIGDDEPTEFVTDSFRGVDELVRQGLVFRTTDDFGREGVSDAGNRLALDQAPGVGTRDLIIFDTTRLDEVSVYRVNENGLPVEITNDVLGQGTLNLEGPIDDPNTDLNRFVGSVAGTPTLSLQRSYGVIVRDEGAADGQVDTEKLDDTSVDIELFGSREKSAGFFGAGEPGTDEGEGINLGPGGAANVTRTHEGVFRNSESFDDDEDEQDLEVEEVEIGISSPGETYVPGTEVELSGSITGTADDVVILTRDRDNYFRITTETTDRSEGDYEETNFELDTDAATDQARDIIGQPGVYRYGVIDGIDTDIVTAFNPGEDILGEDGLDETDFNQGSGTQQTIRVVEPSLEGTYRTFDGSVYQPDGLDVRGTLVGPREYLTFLTDDRGNSIVEEFSADDDDGEIDEDDLSLGGLTDGEIQASILSPGRDTVFGDGSFRDPNEINEDPTFEEASLNSFIEFAEELGETGRTQEQVREILLDQTVRQSGSDDLIVTEEFRLTDDSRTSIEDVVPDELRDNLTGINTIEVGETLVARGTTNRNPDDATIIVEAEDGPTIAEVGTGIADEWAADGEEEGDAPGGVWSAEMEIDEEVEPGEYIIRADDGDRIDEATVEIVAEGTLEEGARLQDEAAELQQQVQELQGQIETLEGERDELETQVSDLESQNSDLESQVSDLESQLEEAQQTDQNETDTGEEEEEGQPGFTALAALVALIAVALLALRRREEDE